MRPPIDRLLAWLAGHELAVLLGALLVVACAWGFLRIASEVREGDTRAFDEAMIRALRRPDDPAEPIGPYWMGEAGRDVTALGSVAILVLLTLGVVGFLALDRKYGAMAFVFAATAGGLALSSVLKGYYARPRPEVVPHLMRAYNTSFPSGHAMMAATVYLTLGALLTRVVSRRRQKFYCMLVAVVLTMLVGASRVYMGVHYPSDVLAGWAAGLAWATLCWLVEGRLQRSGQVEIPSGGRA